MINKIALMQKIKKNTFGLSLLDVFWYKIKMYFLIQKTHKLHRSVVFSLIAEIEVDVKSKSNFLYSLICSMLI